MLSQSDFLLFHALVEVFAAIVSFGVFLIAWDTRHFARSSFFLIIGPAFALVGTADILHMLAYKGMGTNSSGSADLATQLWVAARSTEVLAVFVGVLMASRPVWPGVPLAVTVLCGTLLLAAISRWNLFPTCYVEGVGLTPFKVGAEYAFVGLKLATATLLWWRRRSCFDAAAARWLTAYLAISALSELAFTSYISVYDGMNQAGHMLKVAAFLAIYAATSKAVLQRPYTALFGDLQVARQALEGTVADRTRALVEANDLLTTLIDSSPMAIFANDTQGRIILWNSGAERVYGWSAEEALGRPLQTAPPERREEQERMIRQVLDGTPLFGTELERRHKDGSPVIVRDYAAPMRAADGTIHGVVSLVMDITAERAAERAARQGEERLRGLMANVPDAIVTVNEQGIIESASDAAEPLFGYTLAELVGFSVAMLMPHEPTAANDDVGAKVIAGLRQLVGRGSLEVTARHKDGRDVPIEMAVNEMRVDGRRLYVGVLRDISERLRERSHKAAMERELMRAQKMEAIGSLAGGIAHEVNNMLTPILGLSEVALLRLPHGSPVRENLEKVVEAAGRARDILRKVLAFSRVDTAPPVPLPLRSLVQEALPLVRATLPLEARLNCVLPDDELVARCAHTEFQQILMNLCANAGQAVAGRDGRIEISLVRRPVSDDRALTLGLRPGDHAVLSVADNGIGMDAQTIDKVFEPFFTTKPVGEGTGMGLSVVHAIVAAWNGAIAVDSAPGSGATFHVYLPMAEDVSRAEA